MKRWNLFCLLGCLIPLLSSAQNPDLQTKRVILRSTISSSGTTAKVSTDKQSYYVSQSIGQSGLTGSFANTKKAVLQGFQQPPTGLIGTANNGLVLQAIIYPNPFNDILEIEFSETVASNVQIEIYNHTGKLLLKEIRSPKQLLTYELGNLNKGIYLIRLSSGNKSLSKKLLKK